MRHIAHTSIVYIDDEWIVRCWDQDGVRFAEADYYTDDRDDARHTADAMLEPWLNRKGGDQ